MPEKMCPVSFTISGDVTSNKHHTGQDCIDLLDLLKKEKVKVDELEKLMDCARNEWKQRAETAEARCEALEKALKEYAACENCIYDDEPDQASCDNCYGDERSLWCFDIERFGGSE